MLLDALIPFATVFFAEFGDKTQLLIILLVVRFKKKLPIFLGMLTGIFLNHLPAAYLGKSLSDLVNPDILPYIVGGLFMLMGGAILLEALAATKAESKAESKADVGEGKSGELENSGSAKVENVDDSDIEKEDKMIGKWSSKGPFLASLVLFFVSEMGDKTQLAAMMLSGEFHSTLLVVAGTSLAVSMANLIPLMFGQLLVDRISEKAVRIFSGAIFLALGLHSMLF